MSNDIIKRPESVNALLANIKGFTGKPAVVPTVLGSGKGITQSASSLLQIAFLFDTTGSMYPYFKQGKEHIAKIIDEVIKKHRNAQFCYVAYKNHSDEDMFDGGQPFFATPFTNNPEQIRRDMEKVESGGGGDSLTCLECVFHHLNTETKWVSAATKVVVLIGDMPPHGVVDSIGKCPRERDYRTEIEALKRKGVKIYSVFCCRESDLNSPRMQKIKKFFRDTPEQTDGKYLELADIDAVVDLMTGICMKETGHLGDFIKDLRAKGLLLSGSAKERALLALTDGRKG